MGLTKGSTGSYALKEMFRVNSETPNDIIISLAGNPNTGKSTVFNSLTGLNQHTGNWPGKTVTNAQGRYINNKNINIVVDLPGTYSLFANSVEEEVAREFICFGNPNVTVVVTDATCLERNLNLVLQVLEITDKVVVCVNLMDEARKKKIEINLKKLSNLLGVPVVGTSARNGEGLDELKQTIENVALGITKTNPTKLVYNDIIENALFNLEPYLAKLVENKLNSRWLSLRLLDGDQTILKSINEYISFDLINDNTLLEKLDESFKILQKNNMLNDYRDEIVSSIVNMAEKISNTVITYENEAYNKLDRKIDSILTSKLFGIPIMIVLLGFIFWLTIKGANFPSQVISYILFFVEEKLTELFIYYNFPNWLHGVFILGMYRTLAWVVSVMLPPMAIFFPIFTLLEDLGYLPRIAFNLDHFFKKACTHGKQALTMCMGFGCNAAGVIGCRIIDSPRERIIAIITNNFVPCNGRFPTLIALSIIFIAGSSSSFKSIIATFSVLVAVVLSVIITLLISKLLSKTILKGLPSSFNLELPPYRIPRIKQLVIRSILDRTLFVLGRAIIVAAPAGIIIWLMANLSISDTNLLSFCANFLNPIASLIGLDGYILMAFILGLPANEIVLPILIMSYMSKGAMLDLDNLNQLRQLLIDNNWTWLTAVCTMLFSLNHWPCATTLLTIRKETKSLKWTCVSFILPTLVGILICFIVTQSSHLLGLV